MHRLLTLLAITCAASCARPHPVAPLAPLPPDVKAVDVYGTTRYSADDLRRMLGPRFDRWLAAIEHDDMRRQLQDEMDAQLRGLGFSFAHLAQIGYFSDAGAMAYYVTIDLVEADDRARRIVFAAAPTDELADVDGLAAAWDAYAAKGVELMQAGAIGNQRVACPAFHCMFGFDHPALAPYGVTLAKVPTHRDELIQRLRRARDPKLRATTAFLLAHLTDGADVVAQELPALRDPDSMVRNNAMRVLQDIAHNHPEIAVPIEPALAALDFPETTDRNKALAMLEGMSGRSELQPAIRAHAAQLIALLRLQQPNNHDFAYAILKTISGRAYGERDYAAWERWAASLHP